MRKYVLNSDDFTYEPFFDSRNETGFSGQLLIATNKKTGEKLLVKHNHESDVLNEFVAAYIAEHLGFGNPKAYLFAPSPRAPFSCKYAVGIEFMDELEIIQYNELSESQAVDVIHQLALNFLCIQDDIFQMRIWNGKVISYDFSECFNVSNMTIKIHNYGLRNQLLESFNGFKSRRLFNPNYALTVLKWSDDRLGEVSKIYFEGLLPLLNMNQDVLKNIMTEVFPEDIADYYNDCITHMKKQIESLFY